MFIDKINFKNIKELESIIQITANQAKLLPAIVEKDFWVVTILDWIFNKSKYKDMMVFKGGTSLSKAYGLIDRFSEDIDLIVKYKYLSITPKQMECSDLNHNQINKFEDDVAKKLETFINANFLIDLIAFLKDLTNKDVACLVLKERNNIVIEVDYPKLFNLRSIKQIIKIEFNVFADFSTATNQTIESIVCKYNPSIFNGVVSNIQTLSWIRTFWEKLTILHNKSFVDQLNNDMSRHYYDIYNIAHTKDKEKQILNSIEELLKVATFKNKYYYYYYSKKGDYLLISKAKLSLIPQNPVVLKQLIKSYNNQIDIFGAKDLKFETILSYLKILESKINKAINAN